MNKELVKEIIKTIKKEPKQFVMDKFFTYSPETIPNCGTAACIAGHAVAIHNKQTPKKASYSAMHFSTHEKARDLLEITNKQAERLFYFMSWPKKFKKKHSEDAKQAVARINHFMKTGR